MEVEKNLDKLNVGDYCIRIINGNFEMPLQVTKICDRYIHCGPYIFSKDKGMEINAKLGWTNDHSGSYIKLKL